MATKRGVFLLVALLSGLDVATAIADDESPPPPRADLLDSGKLLATGGVSEIEGAGGGGLVPWALITGYGTQDAIGANVHYTYVDLPNYTLQSAGVAVGLF